MKAVDTNIIVRLIIADDDTQTRAVQALLQQPIWLSLTVLLETAWVLTSRFRHDRDLLVTALTNLIDLDPVVVEEYAAVRWALDRAAEGGDFADMLHVATATRAEAFVTFDRDIARKSGAEPPLPIETLLA